MNTSLPQMLQFGVLLLYINGLFNLIAGFDAGFWPLIIVALAEAAGGYGIANEKRVGYWTGVVASIAAIAVFLYLVAQDRIALTGFSFISTIVDVALVILLLHPQSREHQRLWFR